MAALLTLRLRGEGTSTNRSVWVQAPTEAEAVANAQTVIIWYDDNTSMQVTGASLMIPVEATAVLSQDPPVADSNVHRVARVTNRYDAPTLNKSTVRVPSIRRSLVADGKLTAEGMTGLTSLYNGTLNIRGDSFIRVDKATYGFTKPRKK